MRVDQRGLAIRLRDRVVARCRPVVLTARSPSPKSWDADVSAASVHEAVLSGELCVAPSVRGCIYVVPRDERALSLRIAHHLSEARIRKEHQKLGIPASELDVLGAQVLEALAHAPHTTASLRSALPDGAVRSLGDAGKKLGVTSTLPITLRRLEFAGEIERRPHDGRLDHERYVWAPCALEVGAFSDDDAVAIARRFLTWAGPSTRKEFAAWTGLSQTVAKAALAALDCG